MPSDLCIRSKKGAGEQIRRMSIKLDLFDRSRRMMRKDEFILIPILRPPTATETGELARQCDIEVVSCRLEPAPRPKSLEQILEGVVPEAFAGDLPKSYDMVGDIIIIESLSRQLSVYRRAIGEAMLLLNKPAKTVLLKIGIVGGEFRVPTFELLAGADKRVTIHTEYGTRLKVDLSKAYFSPRLGNERHRISSQVKEGETVVDMFAGVGPFSLMIAREHRVRVFAIDLNPDAIALLEENIGLNRLKGEIVPICGDARQESVSLAGIADRVIMNLPGRSLDFLRQASMLLKDGGGIIHVYTFASGEAVPDAEKRLRVAASRSLGEYSIGCVRVVKPTAPREWQVALDLWVKTKQK